MIFFIIGIDDYAIYKRIPMKVQRRKTVLGLNLNTTIPGNLLL